MYAMTDYMEHLCNVAEVIIFENGCYISALKHIKMVILSSYVLLECINTFYKYSSRLGDLVKRILGFNFWAQELYS